MIRSFRCRETERLFQGETSPVFPPDIQRRAQVKLAALDAATSLQDLARTPGSRLEALKGNRQGQYSIRINDQWRICFTWDNGACQVAVEDYH